MSSPSDPKPPLNIPQGNSPVTPDAERPEDDKRSGNKIEDYKAAISRINIISDFENIGKIPCARGSLLYAIAGGAGIGSIRFLGSRKVWSAANWAVGTFVFTAIVSWEMCQHARAKELAQMRMIQERFPHRHVSKLKRKGEDWQPGQGADEGADKQ